MDILLQKFSSLKLPKLWSAEWNFGTLLIDLPYPGADTELFSEKNLYIVNVYSAPQGSSIQK